MGAEICFDGYLRSLVSAYQQWWRLYTLTDATGRESQQVERDRIASAFFDFGLMVQTVDKEKVESQKEKGEEEKKEKIERLPVLEGICKYAADHVLLVGRPGSGKSTALARLLLQEAENALSDLNAKIPVLVELRYLPLEANESSVCDRILAFIHKHDPALDIDEAGIKQLLRQGRLLLLVDGVNELPSDRGRVMVNQFRELYQKTCPMIFTTRELSAGGDLGIAKRLEMQPLTEPQMQQFVMAYLPTQGEKFLRQLSGRLREFGQTPLLLWMLCSLFQQSEQIPPNLGMVFRAFTVGYGDRIKQDVTLSKDSRAWWGRLLQYLAFKMIVGDSATESMVAISRREAKLVLVGFLQGKVEYPDDCAIRWLEDLLKHHLLQVSNDQIEFRHQLIQEYYAAEWLLGLLPSLSDARLQHDYLNYLKWTEPLALMLELVESEEQAVRVVRLALDVDLRLGARLAGAVKYGFQEKAVGLLIQEIDDWKTPKLYAIKLLGKTKTDFAIEPLIQFLKYTDSNVRRNVAELLGLIGNEKVVEPLIQSLNDSDSNVRRNAVKTLGLIGNEKSVEPLIQSLNDSDSNMRRNVVEALVKIGSKKSIEPLIQLLNNSNPNVRRNTVALLGKIDSELTIEPLIKSLNDSDSNVHKTVVKALVKIGNEEAIESFIQSLNDSDSNVRINSIVALGKIGSEIAIELLIQSLNNSDSNVHRDVAEVLSWIGNEEVIQPLIQSLNNPDSNVHRNSVVALGRIGSEIAIEFLIQSLKNADNNVRRNVAEVLGWIGNEKAIQPLIQSLNDSDSNVRRNVVVALGEILNKKAIESLIQSLNNEVSHLYGNPIEPLKRIVSPDFLPYLIQLKTEESFAVTQYIQSCFKFYNFDIKEKSMLEPQSSKNINNVYIFSPTVASVSASPLEDLEQIDSDTLMQMLASGNINEDPLFSSRTIKALGWIEDENQNTVKILQRVLKESNNSHLKLNAAEALSQIARSIELSFGEIVDESSISLLK
jgi:HEAT repeat protein